MTLATFLCYNPTILVENPVLIQRPIIVKGNKAVVGRSEEKLKENAVVKIEMPTKKAEVKEEETKAPIKQEEPLKVELAPVLDTTDIDSIAENMDEKIVEEKVEAKPVVKKEAKKPKPEIKLTLAESVSNVDMSAKLDKVLNRLNDMETEIARIRQSGDSTQIGSISNDLDALKKELTSINKKPAPRKAAPVVKKKKAPIKRKAPTSAKQVTWELRAAQPGKAWVSPKGQNKMQPIIVGDSLAGIGLITSISYNGSRWVVQGTSGRINQ